MSHGHGKTHKGSGKHQPVQINSGHIYTVKAPGASIRTKSHWQLGYLEPHTHFHAYYKHRIHAWVWGFAYHGSSYQQHHRCGWVQLAHLHDTKKKHPPAAPVSYATWLHEVKQSVRRAYINAKHEANGHLVIDMANKNHGVKTPVKRDALAYRNPGQQGHSVLQKKDSHVGVRYKLGDEYMCQVHSPEAADHWYFMLGDDLDLEHMAPHVFKDLVE